MPSNQMGSGPVQRRSIVFLAAIAGTLFLSACSSAPPADRDRSPNVEVTKLGSSKYFPGEPPYAVGTIPDAKIHDAQRNRDVVMTIEYPTRGGNYPVIVFSHAYGSSKDAYVALTEYWVGHGYVCIKPSHADAGAVRESANLHMEPVEGRGQGRNGGQRGQGSQGRSSGTQVITAPPQPALEELFTSQTPADWQNRTRDITLILDSLSDLEQRYPELVGKMDRSKVGVGGDSYGAFTTMLLSGMTSYKTNPPTHPADPRVRAGLAISPQGISDVFGLTKDSWSGVKIPMMYITGSADRGLGENGDPKWRHDPFAFGPAGDKYLVSFTGARHASLIGGTSPIMDRDIARPTSSNTPQVDPWGNQLPPQQSQTNRPGSYNVTGLRRVLGSLQFASIAFWDTYLKNDANARDYLTGDSFTAANGPAVMAERK